MTPAEVLAALTPAQRHGFAFWTSIIDALAPREESGVSDPVGRCYPRTSHTGSTPDAAKDATPRPTDRIG